MADGPWTQYQQAPADEGPWKKYSVAAASTQTEDKKTTVGQDAAGILESAAHLLSGGVASLAGGLNYATSLAAGRGTEDAMHRKQMTESALTYEPRTTAGKEITENLERPFKKLAEKGEQAGSYVAEKTGSPLLGAATRTVIEGAPAALPAVPRVLRRGAQAIAPEISRVVRPVAERIARAGEQRAAVRAAEEAPKQAAIAQARQIGLRLPPSEAGGPVGKVLEGASGKIQTEMQLSRQNARIINRTVGRELGLTDRQPLTEANLERLRQQQYAVYNRVRTSGRITMDDQYRAELRQARERTQQADQDFPEDTNERIDEEIRRFDRPDADAGSMLDKIRSLRERASRNMRAPDPDHFELGLAQRRIATAMENQIDRQLQADTLGGGVRAADPNLINEFRNARRRLAQIYNVEAALSPHGNISAAALARQLRRDVPLSGGLRAIAESYQEFPRVMRYVDNLGGHAPFSALDYLVGGVEAAANPASTAKVVGALAGRPIARGIITSEAYQRAAVRPRAVRPSMVSRMARRIAGERPRYRPNQMGQWVPAPPARVGDMD